MQKQAINSRGQLPKRRHLVHRITHWRILVDVAAQRAGIVDTPLPALFSGEPDYTARPPSNLLERRKIRIVLVVTSITKDDHGSTAINQAQLITTKLGQCIPQIGAVTARRPNLTQDLGNRLFRS
jgi:hypothetical protein